MCRFCRAILFLTLFVLLSGCESFRSVCSEAEYSLAKMVTAIYPPQHLEKGTEGYVVAKLTIMGAGKAPEIEILESVPNGIFTASAIQALEQYRFKVIPSHCTLGPVTKRYKLTFDAHKKDSINL